MRYQTVAAMLAGFMLYAALAAGAGARPKTQKKTVWLTSMPRAKAAAEKTGKPILINFTGSDWCGWCIRLKKEVFSKPEFKKWAAKNVVLLEVDFPKRKQQSAETKKRNNALMRQYAVQGFPTIVFTEAAGKSLGRSGYMQGGPKVWTAKADTILAGFKGRKQDARPASADGARTDDGPDLVISSFSAVLTGPQRITYSYTITNVGTKPANLDGPTGSNADNVSVQAFMSKDTLFRNEGDLPAGGKTLGRSSSGSLRPGGTRKGRFSATVREEVAEFPYLILMVDWGKVVDESNEENNLAVIGIGKSSKKTTKR